MKTGLKNVVLCDTKGAIYEGRDNLNPIKAEMAKISNLNKKQGQLFTLRSAALVEKVAMV